MNAREAAHAYLERGWAPIPVPIGQKRPTIEGWPDLRLKVADLDRHFNGKLVSVGVLTGTPSNGLTDVDLDARGARSR